MENIILWRSLELDIWNYLESTLLCYPLQAKQHVLKLQLLPSVQADVNKPELLFSVTSRDYKDSPEKFHLGNEIAQTPGKTKKGSYIVTGLSLDSVQPSVGWP
jgi:hypothetical protein